MPRLLTLVGSMVFWGCGLWATLTLRTPAAWEHAMCGAWGCGPPLSAVVSYHSFWLVLLAGPMALIGLTCSRAQAQQFGKWLLLIGVAAALGIVILDLAQWMPRYGQLRWIPARSLFGIAITVDVPALQLLIVGGALVWLTRSPAAAVGGEAAAGSVQKSA